MSEIFHLKTAGNIAIPATGGTVAFTDTMPEKYDDGRVFIVPIDGSGNIVTVTGTGTIKVYGDPGLGIYHTDANELTIPASELKDPCVYPMPAFPGRCVSNKMVLAGDFTPAVSFIAIAVRN